MGYKRILVALNQDTKSTSPVFDRALELANSLDAKLMLFHCMPQDTVAELEDRIGSLADLEQSDAWDKFDSRHKKQIEHVRAWLEGLCQVCVEKGVVIRSNVEIGRPGRAVVDLAKSWKADLVVIGQTKRSALGDALTGSVTSRVVHSSPCSVLLVHE